MKDGTARIGDRVIVSATGDEGRVMAVDWDGELTLLLNNGHTAYSWQQHVEKVDTVARPAGNPERESFTFDTSKASASESSDGTFRFMCGTFSNIESPAPITLDAIRKARDELRYGPQQERTHPPLAPRSAREAERKRMAAEVLSAPWKGRER